MSPGNSHSSEAAFNEELPQVLLACEYPILLEGLRQIAEQSGLGVTGSVRDRNELLLALDIQSPDLVVIDAAIPGLPEQGEIVQALRERQIAVLFLTAADADNSEDALSIARTADISEISAAMREALIRDSDPGARSTESSERRLTPRQVEVLQLITDGKTAKEVGSTLNISARTVEFHKTRIMETLSLRTTAQLTKYAVRNRLSGA